MRNSHCYNYYHEIIQNMNNSVPGTSLEVDSSGVGVITLRNPPVNALHPKGALNTLYGFLE